MQPKNKGGACQRKPPFTVLLATRNKHKIEEIKAILGKDFKCLTLSDSFKLRIAETGRTLLENSLLKAQFFYKIIKKPCLAEDSGLFIDKLNGAPGIYSSRYGKTDQERIERILNELGNKKNRQARFKVVFVYYYAPGRYEVFTGDCIGRIAYEPKGKDGFGYDPIFIPKGFNKTFAELGFKIKNLISHRAKALRKFKRYIKGNVPFSLTNKNSKFEL